jgi:hypothetical protein
MDLLTGARSASTLDVMATRKANGPDNAQKTDTVKGKAARKRPAAKKPAERRPATKKPASRKTSRSANAAKASPAKRRARGAPSPDDMAAFEPGILVEHEDGYSLVYTDFPHVPAFDERGIEGGGHTWHGLVEHVLEADAPEALDALDFDPEAGMFCALSEDLGALAAVGRALKKLEDPALLTKLAGAVDLSELD